MPAKAGIQGMCMLAALDSRFRGSDDRMKSEETKDDQPDIAA